VEVSIELNHFNVYTTLMTSIFPIFLSFYLGAWADLFGRKPLFYLVLGAYFLSQCVTTVCAYFIDSKKEYLLLAHVPTALSGGWAVWMLAMNAFVADITAPEDRAFRYGMMHLAHSLGRPLGAPLGAYLLRTGGFLCVFSSALVGITIGSVYLLYRIRSYKWNPPKTDKKKRNNFSLFHITDAFKATFKKRAGPNRKYILIMMAIHICTLMPFFGEFTVAFSYVRIRYSWGVDEYSTYSSIVSSASIVGQAIFMPTVALLKVNEAWIMTLCFVNLFVRHIVKGFASEPWMYYLGALIDTFGSYASSIMRSMLSCCVAPDELGKIYALLSAFDNLLPLGITEAYSLIFEATIESKVPGTIFFISAAISAIALLSSVYILITLRGKRMSEVSAAGAGREENDKNSTEFSEKTNKTDIEISDIDTVITYM